jgi:hypothetical protein
MGFQIIRIHRTGVGVQYKRSVAYPVLTFSFNFKLIFSEITRNEKFGEFRFFRPRRWFFFKIIKKIISFFLSRKILSFAVFIVSLH